jgi:hypothetical protein
MTEHRALTAVALGLTVFSLFPIWLVRFLPLQDYPYHLMRVHAAMNYRNPAFAYEAEYLRSFFPTPYILADYLMCLFASFMSLATAGKAVVSLYVIALPWSVFYMFSAVDSEQWAMGFFSYLFIYNWFFNIGFLNFFLSIPLFFFSLAYWWRYKGQLNARRLLVFAALILLVYLCHIYTFVLLLGCLAALWLFSDRTVAVAVRTAVGLLPSIVLLVWIWAGRLRGSSTVHEPPVFLYESLRKKVSLFIGSGLPYFVSFSPDRDRKILYVAGLIVLGLIFCNILSFLRSPFLRLVVALGFVYLASPEHAGGVGFISQRLLIFIVLLALFAIRLPSKTVFRRSAVSAIVVLAVIRLFFTWVDYRSLNWRLNDLYQAIEQIPPGHPVAFWTDRSIMYVGQHTPFALFGAYYYIERGGKPVVWLGEFVGPLRVIRLRDPAKDVASVHVAEGVLEAGDLGVGSYVVVVGRGRDPSVQETAEKSGYLAVRGVDGTVVYRKVRTVPKVEPSSAPLAAKYFREGIQKDFDYLVVYGNPVGAESTIGSSFDEVFSQGLAHVFRKAGP